MLSDFMQILQTVESAFFGATIMADTFFTGVLQIFNAIILIIMFYGVFILPFKWILRYFIKFLKEGKK